jgi:glycosyltransferase involved in cell wall biosynthesis
MDEEIRKIIYIGDFKFQLENAESQLVLGNSKILRDLGYQVVFIGNTNVSNGYKSLSQSKTSVDGFDLYEVLFSKHPKEMLKIIDIHRQIVQVISSYNFSSVDAVIFYGTPSLAWQIKLLSKWCKKRGIATIANCVDLSSLKHGKFYERIIKIIDRYWRYHIFKYEMDGIIAVSNYIANYFEKGKKKSITIIPPLKDQLTIEKPILNYDGTIQLLYAGIPFPTDGRVVGESGYKDRLDILIDVLCNIRDNVAPFQLNIYGLSKEQYLRVVYGQEELLKKNNDIIRFFGRVKHSDVLLAERTSDFSLLIRTRNRMTMAGFSTKLVESISCGVPIITTDTSDYRTYVKENEHGYFINVMNMEEAKIKLSKILSMDRQQLNSMKLNCYESNLFDYRRYKNKMQNFINNVIKEGR